MNAGELRALLVGVPDDVEVVTSGLDHNYELTSTRETQVVKAEANHNKTHFWFEPENGRLMNPSHVLVDVFLIGDWLR